MELRKDTAMEEIFEVTVEEAAYSVMGHTHCVADER